MPLLRFWLHMGVHEGSISFSMRLIFFSSSIHAVFSHLLQSANAMAILYLSKGGAFFSCCYCSYVIFFVCFVIILVYHLLPLGPVLAVCIRPSPLSNICLFTKEKQKEKKSYVTNLLPKQVNRTRIHCGLTRLT